MPPLHCVCELADTCPAHRFLHFIYCSIGWSISSHLYMNLYTLSFYRVCVVCLAPSHPLLTNPDLEITSIDFQIGSVDRQDNKVSGKRKNKLESLTAFWCVCIWSIFCFAQGAQKLTPTSTLCVVNCNSDVKYKLYRYLYTAFIFPAASVPTHTTCIYSCIRGCLVEMNECIVSDPTIIQRQVCI